MDQYVIALDGVSGSGKSSTARRAAEVLDILYLDTGAMYRTVTHLCQKNNIPPTNLHKATEFTRNLQFDVSANGQFLVNGEDVSGLIRLPRVNEEVSDYSAIPGVREIVVDIQREIGNSRSSILEGRDIGTVVFPDAKFKFFLWASPEVRTERRIRELQENGILADYKEVLANLNERDRKDSSRRHSPLTKAEDSIFIDTSHLNFEQQVRKITDMVSRICMKTN
ncbi:(d)CMP kinase [Fibrobacterota bacterium]